MTDFSNLFAATEQKYGLPPGILRATAQVESHFNPAAVSNQGAQGIMQLLPSTAKNLGADPRDVPQAVDAAGRLWQQNLQASGGDIDRAAMMYHGGRDPKNWGPETQAYPGKLAAALGPAQAPSDPVEAALSGGATVQPSQPAQGGGDPNDPVEAALSGGTSAANAGRANSGGSGSNSGQADRGGIRISGNGTGRNAVGSAAGAQGGQEGTPATGLQQHSLVNDFHSGAQWLRGTADAAVNGVTAGLIKPFNALVDTVVPFADVGEGVRSDKAWNDGFLTAFHRNLAAERQQSNKFREDHPTASITADIAGGFASPFNQVFAPAEGAGFFRSIPNFAGQAALYGGTRGYADTGDPAIALKDAGISAVVGPLGAAAANAGGKVIGAALRARSTISNAIPTSEKAAAARLIDTGASADQVVAEHPNLDPNTVEAWVSYRAKGGKEPVTFASPPPDEAPIVITGKRYAAALGTQGQRRGIESVSNVPPQVTQDSQRLTAAGVSPQEAQAEADIRYVGGQPTVANVTRTPAEQRAMFEGAKMNTPEGAQLADTIANNNQALHNTVIRTVENYGGVPAQGEAAQTAAEALAKNSDQARAGVTAKYRAARAADGDVKINTDELRELLQSPEMATPTNPQVAQLSRGILSHLQATDSRAGTSLRTPEEIEQLRQLANSAYDPMGGPVNSAVDKIGSALNDSLDQLDQASAAWKIARAAHRDWASQYSDPAGVAQLIARDAKGNFLNADQWRLSENGLIDRLNDKPFAQVVGQLKNIGATDALNRLKAGIVQRAYERATNAARDQLSNPIVNGKLFQNELNKIGMPKLQTLFSPDEIAHLATIGRAARALNEAVPGTVNTSGTASSLVNALAVKPGSHPYMKGFKYVAALTGHIPAAVAVHGAEHLSTSAAQRAVRQGVKEQINPALARAMSARSNARIENAQFRAAIGRALRNRGAVPAADNDRQRSIGRRLQNAL